MTDDAAGVPLDGAVAAFLSRVLDSLVAQVSDATAVREAIVSLGGDPDAGVAFIVSKAGEITALRDGATALVTELARPHPDLVSLVPRLAPLWRALTDLSSDVAAPKVTLPDAPELPDPVSIIEVMLSSAIEQTIRAQSPAGWSVAKALHLVGVEVPVFHVVSDVLESPTGYIWRRFQHLRRHLDITITGIVSGPRTTSVVTMPLAATATVPTLLSDAVPSATVLLGRITLRLAADAFDEPHVFTFDVAGDGSGGGLPTFAAVALTSEAVAEELRLSDAVAIDLAPFGQPFGVAATGFGDAVALHAAGSPSIELSSVFAQGFRLGSPESVQLVVSGPVLDPRMSADGWGLRLGLESVELVIANGVAGPIIGLLLPADGIRLKGRLVAVADESGLHLEGGVGLKTTWPDTLRLPGLLMRDVTTEVGSLTGGGGGGDGGGGGLSLTAAGTVTVELGPLTVTIVGLGLRQTLLLREDGSGNLGLFELAAPEVTLPTGLGVSIDATIIRGGGFLAFAEDEVTGALELALTLGSVEIAVRAVGVIGRVNGKVSFVVVMSIEFSPAIEIFLGLTLNAVGGVFGVNRTLDEDGLSAMVRAGRMEDVLFPRDLAARAVEVIAAVKQVFPERDGQFVVGPMLKLGWGRPVSFVTVSVGVVFTFPDPVVIAIVGSMRISLPTPDVPIVDIRADFAGSINASTGEVRFDASLANSRIATFDVTGDLALRAGPSGFLFTAGGFHPKFTPPASLGAVSRLAISISPSPILSIRAEAYFAVTASTVQFGGRLFVVAKLGPIGARGNLGLDVLIHTEPTFSFVAEISGQFRLTLGGEDILSAELDVLLEGPHRWHARARASISFLFFSVSGTLELEWGERAPLTLGPAVRVSSKVHEALGAPHVWCHVIPAQDGAMVMLREGTTALHPLGRLRLTQTVAPLGVALERFGSAPVTDPAGVTVTVAAAFATVEPAQELFAAAQFFTVSDEERLSKPAFVPHLAGFTVQGSDWAPLADPVAGEVFYEESSGERRQPRGSRHFGGVAEALLGWSVLGAAGRAHGETVAPVSPRAGLRLNDIPYAVVDASTGTPASGGGGFSVENAFATSMRSTADAVVMADYELAGLVP